MDETYRLDLSLKGVRHKKKLPFTGPVFLLGFRLLSCRICFPESPVLTGVSVVSCLDPSVAELSIWIRIIRSNFAALKPTHRLLCETGPPETGEKQMMPSVKSW